mgnify:CR=1 FL=1
MAEITKDTGIIEAVQKYPQILEVFQQYGLGCVGCMAAHFETIGQAPRPRHRCRRSHRRSQRMHRSEGLISFTSYTAKNKPQAARRSVALRLISYPTAL